MVKTEGHVGSTGGLRGHSVGGMYPWGIVGYGNDTWAATNMVTGAVRPRVATAAQALRDAESQHLLEAA